MKLKYLLILVVLISCEKESEYVNFQFINATDHLIDTLFLNNTGTGGFLVGPDPIIRIEIEDTTDLIQLEYSSMPLTGKAIIDAKSYFGYFAYSTHSLTDARSFDPGDYWITITDFDTTYSVIRYKIVLK